MKKKLILILTNLVLTIGAISLVLVNGKYETDYVKAKEEPYTLNLSNLSSSNTTLTTSNGNSIEFEVSGYNDGVFSNGSYIKNLTPINGIESLAISFETLNADLTISYGWNSIDYYVIDGKVNSENRIFTFSGSGPSFFRIQNNNVNSVTAANLYLTYSCSETEAPSQFTNVYYSLSSDGQSYYVSGYSTGVIDAVILPRYNGLPVTSIGYAAFDCSSLKSVIIPDSITSIEGRAFSNCNYLTSVVIPDSVTTIKKGTFYGCSNLVSVDIPRSVNSIEEDAFYSCTSLTSIVLPDSITSISSYAFTGCSSLTDASIEVSDIQKTMSMSGKYFIGPDIRLINQSGNEITEIVIPNTVTEIDVFAFCKCKNLVSVEIPSSVVSINNYAFYRCISLTSIVIPDSVISIGDYAFEECYSLSSVNLSNDITSIGYEAFKECVSLTSIVIPNSADYVGGYAFSNCSSIMIFCEAESQPSNWSANWNASNYYVIWGYQGTVVQDGYIYALGMISDQKNAIVMEFDASIIDFNPATEINGYPVTNVCENIFQKSDHKTKIKSIVLPNGYTSISDFEFQGCSSLMSFIIPSSVTSIGYGAFRDCTSLASINIPNSVKSIGYYAFSNCSSLASIFIPNSVTSIGNYAFYQCSSLTIYCERESKASNWDYYWNYNNRPVVWGYTPS